MCSNYVCVISTNHFPKENTMKEATFMWLVWHNAMAFLAWRARISPRIDTSYATIAPWELKNHQTIVFFMSLGPNHLESYSVNCSPHSRDVASDLTTCPFGFLVVCIWRLNPTKIKIIWTLICRSAI